MTEKTTSGLAISIGSFVILAIAVLLVWGCPQYDVYSKRMSGLAQLAEAQSNREVVVAEARAKEEAARHLAAADTERAVGVAKSNQIIGESLKKNESYLTWLWIESLKDGKNDVIYVPTEGNLPVLEAQRFSQHFANKDTSK